MTEKYFEKENKKPPLIILTGPTAAGKTDLSINLAKRINGEIISADSVQVYKRLDIGSAKIKPEEMQGIPHHLIDIYEPDFPFDVTVFQKLAKEKVEEIISRGRIPIVVGGTGFYIQALLYDIEFDGAGSNETLSEKNQKEDEDDLGKADDPEYRERLYERLKEVDPASAEIIHMNNVRKVMRALEFYDLYGYPISEHNKREREKSSAYNSAYFVLNMEREKLYDRINRRVDIMRQEGLVHEVESLKSSGINMSMNSMQAIGYKEIYKALDETSSIVNTEEVLDEAFEEIKKNTRHFAKRQLTWFRREKDCIWLDKDEHTEEELLEQIIEICSSKKIIISR